MALRRWVQFLRVGISSHRESARLPRHTAWHSLLTGYAEHIACKLNHRDLESETNPCRRVAGVLIASKAAASLPRNGTLFSRAYCVAKIFPSVPRFPKPPGITMPLQDRELGSGKGI